MGSRPKTPAPTAMELEAERRARRELDTLTSEENERLKAIRRGRTGRRTLLGSGSELGLGRGLGAGGLRPPGGGGGTRSGGSGGGVRGGAGAAGTRGGILGSATGMAPRGRPPAGSFLR